MKKMHKKQNTNSGNLFMMPGYAQTNTKGSRPQQQKRKPKLRSLFLLVFTLWALYTFLFVLLPNKSRLDDEHQQLQTELSSLQAEEQKLSGDLNDLQDNQYIARLARKLYNMIKPGEIPYRPGE